MYAVPPPLSQADLAAKSDRTLLLLSQVLTGRLTEALPDQAQDGLQQSQYLVVLPDPEAREPPAWNVGSGPLGVTLVGLVPVLELELEPPPLVPGTHCE